MSSYVDGKISLLNVQLNEDIIGELDWLRHMGVVLSTNGRMETALKRRLGEGRRVAGALKNVLWR